MTLPAVTITELDGTLGVLPPSSGRLFAIVGPASGGTVNAPATFAKIKDVQNAFVGGQVVEAAAHYIERYGRSVLLVKSAASVAAAVSAVDDHDATGTSVVTVAGGAAPRDDYELMLKIVTGGTRGVAGITYQTSLDGGRTMSPVTALGTGTSVVFPDSAGVTFDLAAGTVVAGEYYTAIATPALPSAADLGAALDALKVTAVAWELVLVTSAIDADAFDMVELKVAGMFAAGKPHAWIGNTRITNAGETEAQYLTAMTAISTAKSTIYGSLYSGGGKLTSSVSGRKYRRPIAWGIAAREASSSQEVNAADPNLGPLPGYSIRDANGNPDEHDEAVNPGLDDLRFGTVRTLDGYPGVYVTRPRVFAPVGSDFSIMPNRRVMNLAHEILRVYFTRRLNQPVRVSRATGYLLPSEATEIELGALAALRAGLLTTPKASDVMFRLSRTDNVLSTKTLTGQVRVLPLAYPEFIDLEVGFVNPATQLQQAA